MSNILSLAFSVFPLIHGNLVLDSYSLFLDSLELIPSSWIEAFLNAMFATVNSNVDLRYKKLYLS